MCRRRGGRDLVARRVFAAGHHRITAAPAPDLSPRTYELPGPLRPAERALLLRTPGVPDLAALRRRELRRQKTEAVTEAATATP